jgi:hypothetical protein
MSSERKAELGKFIWHDLRTNDPEAAVEFYTSLFGWTVRKAPFGVGDPYQIFWGDHGGVGGVVPQPPERHSHWIGYVAVKDVDAAVQQAQDGGGTAPHAPMELPRVGSFAVIGHPTGGYISPSTWNTEALPPQFEGPPPTGRFVWNELLTPDPATAGDLFAGIFGWDRHEMDMGEAGTYTVFRSDGKDRAGMMPMPADAEGPPQWLSYISVDDVDATAAKVTELGGVVFKAPADIPEIGRFAVCGDPTGAPFAIFTGVSS